ncbi:MAG: TlyA family RNA methyltransferase [Oscillospiraceae bacterium]|nr:TlyA family RNA methyltransferase [Oscillospiraceae bacterium]
MKRLDKELHNRNLAKSRTAAAELIANHVIRVNGEICARISRIVTADDVIEICGDAPDTLRYVSRAGLKLEHALRTFGLDLPKKICLDVGASTGGFTDCMIQHGASRVYAVDVGTNQLVDSLKQDERVVSMEQCDIRNAEIPEDVDFIAVDVSFISAKLILPELRKFVKTKADAVVLIKPQFELGKRHKGVITNKKTQTQITDDMMKFAEDNAFHVKGLCDSPVIGKSGNREFLMWMVL